jgi:hypothetical protein
MKKQKTAKIVKMSKGGATNKDMGSMGRNLARAAAQTSGGKMRGAGAATKGTKISAKMG